MKLIKFSAPLIAIGLLAASLVFAQDRLIPCSGLNCSLCDLLEMFKRLITLGLKIGTALAALFVAWGSFVIMTAGATGGEKKMEEGKKIIWTAITGILIAFAAWLILGTVLQILTGSPSKLPWNEIKCALK